MAERGDAIAIDARDRTGAGDGNIAGGKGDGDGGTRGERGGGGSGVEGCGLRVERGDGRAGLRAATERDRGEPEGREARGEEVGDGGIQAGEREGGRQRGWSVGRAQRCKLSVESRRRGRF